MFSSMFNKAVQIDVLPFLHCSFALFTCPVAQTLPVTTRQSVERFIQKPESYGLFWRRSRVPKRWVLFIIIIVVLRLMDVKDYKTHNQ